MNPLLRSARWTLMWGLLPALSLVLLVLVGGIDPKVMVAFRLPEDHSESQVDYIAEVPDEQPPEHFAQAESNTRLDIAKGSGPAVKSAGRPKINARPSPSKKRTAEIDPPEVSAQEAPMLPPLPQPVAEAATPGRDSDAGPVFELPPPPDFEEPATEVVPPPSKTAARSHLSAAGNAAGSLAPPQVEKVTLTPDPQFVAKLVALQEQLDRIATAQEQHRSSQQTWLESHYQQHQEQLEKKLAGIEAGLRELQDKSELLSTLAKNHIERPAPHATITRGNRTVTSLSGSTLSGPGVVQDVLGSLAEKANVNLTLSINVAGDVEMSLQDTKSPAEPRPQSNGYIVGKDGRKVHVNPPVPQPQSEDYLPPIVNNPESPNRE